MNPNCVLNILLIILSFGDGINMLYSSLFFWRKREVCLFCLYCLNSQCLLNLPQAGCPAPTLPTPSHSSELSLIRSTMMSLCANSGHCSDPIWLHNSAVFLNAIDHFQFFAILPWPSTLPPSPAFPSTSPSLLCGLSSIQPLDMELCKAKVFVPI